MTGRPPSLDYRPESWTSATVSGTVTERPCLDNSPSADPRKTKGQGGLIPALSNSQPLPGTLSALTSERYS